MVRYNIFYPTSWYGIYVDDGGVGVEAYGNIFYGVGCAIVSHEGRDNNLHDNVLIDTGVSVTHEIYDNMLDAMRAGTLDLTDRNTAWGEYYGKWVDYFSMLEANPYYKGIVLTERPEVFGLSVDPADILKSNFVLAPYNVLKNNLSVSLHPEIEKVSVDDSIGDLVDVEGNRTVGTDVNPGFINPTLGDYRLKDGADFIDIPYSEIGRY